MPRLRLALALGLAVLALAPGCGRRGTLRPPQFVSPRPVSDLEVRSVPGGLEIRFRRPDRTVDGHDMSDLGFLELWRSCEPRPDMLQVANFPIVNRGSFRKNTRITIHDDAPGIGEACIYRVIAVTTDGYRSLPAQSEPVRREAAAVAVP
ncbi:MAG: hypothetical protein VCC00_12265 [Deltaproteobacteria bacterium]